MAVEQTLPPPDEVALSQSQALADAIRDEMSLTADGAISFRHFMDLCLYHPGLGYYVAGSRKFGREGDFITAPELGSVFARCLANQVDEVLLACAGDTVLEFGAGSGRLACDLLLALEGLGRPPERYLILEPSPDLRERQRELIGQRIPQWLDRVSWLNGLPEQPLRGCIIANEVLDAMPVVRLRLDGDEHSEQSVALAEDGFEFGYRPLPQGLEQTVDDLARTLGDRPAVPYLTEINPYLDGWFSALSNSLDEGAALIIDYGYTRAEYYRPERVNGTLSCHYRHYTHADPFVYPGLQDITAHVDFTAAAQAADHAGLEVLGFTHQMAFLTGNGLEAIVAESDPDDAPRHLALAQEIKTLTMPGEMGELFKVLAVGRGITGDLAGFRLMDQRWRL